MTCYMRHLHWLFQAIDVPYDAAHRIEVDMALRSIFGLGESAQCPEIWAAVKALSAAETAALPARVLLAIGK